jgi:putative membrane protein
MTWCKDILHGLAFGVANIIPGVSGGTLALVLGFYERLLKFLNRLTLPHFLELIRLKCHWLRHPLEPNSRAAFWGRLADEDWGFMFRLILGAGVAVVGLASLMDTLLNEQFALTYAFFFGLILLSIQVPWKEIHTKGAAVWINLVLGLAITVGIAAAVNPAEKAQRKSDTYQAQAGLNSPQSEDPQEQEAEVGIFDFTVKYIFSEYVMIFVAGGVAISAMVLPGISGSLIMILMGQYFILIRAISSFTTDWLLDDLLFLTACGLGMAAGLLLTARLVEIALIKAHDATMAFLTGLIVGSLYALWPFKEMRVLDEVQRDGSILTGRTVASNINQFPTELSTWLPVLAVMALGAGVMWGVMRLEARSE